MANIHHIVVNAGRLLTVGVLFFLIQGCHTPLIKVDVDSYAATTGKCQRPDGTPSEGIEGCGTPQGYAGSATGFWHQQNPGNPDGHIITSSENLSCASGSTKCPVFRPCGGGNWCRSTYKNDGTCFCACGKT